MSAPPPARPATDGNEHGGGADPAGATVAAVGAAILVIDDEAGIRQVLRDVLEDEGYTVTLAEDGLLGLTALADGAADGTPFGLVILDVWLPSMGGMEVLEQIRERQSDVAVVVISGHASIDLAVKAVKMGAFDFLEKPLSLDRTTTVVRNALRQKELLRENRTLRSSLLMEDELIGEAPPMQAVRGLIEQSATADATVLVTGENGTGKELVAKLIHLRSGRAEHPFVEVNCAAIPETLIESELFGHEKGAFTSAISRRQGKFELADGGTLFLDEIADMSLATQAKILRVIQELRFERVGGERSLEVDVRLIAATNKDLEQEVAAGRFREDLFFRLNVIPIVVPALRERRQDIPALAEYFLAKFAQRSGRSQKQLTVTALELLQDYRWRGNIRELKNFIERVTILSDNQTVDADEARAYLGSTSAAAQGDPDTPAGEAAGDGAVAAAIRELGHLGLSEARDQFERELIGRRLQQAGNNVAAAAVSLGISPSNLHNKLRKHGIKRP